MYRYRSFLFFAICFIVLSSSCTHKTQPKILRTNFVGFGKGDVLDPSLLKFAQKYFVIDNMTTKLVGIGNQDQYVNELASSIEFSTDKKTIRITIKNSKFSDGSPITAHDVAMSLKRAALQGSPHTNIEDLWVGSSTLKDIDDQIPGIVVKSKRELVLKLTREAKEILYFLSMADLGILHSSQYSKKKLLVEDWLSVTSGPYSAALNSHSNIKLIENKFYDFKNDRHPIEVQFNELHGEDLSRAIKGEGIDIGFVTFNDYLKNEDLINKNNYKVLGEKYDALAFLVLNINSKKFSSSEVRWAVLKSVYEKFRLDGAAGKATSKANQFFLPGAKGHVEDKIVREKILSLRGSQLGVKKALGGSLRVEGIRGMKAYIPKDFGATLSVALGDTQVYIDLETPNKDGFRKFKANRNFEAYVIAVGMSKKVLGEVLNFQYLTDPPHLLDPTGNIKRLLKKYQMEDRLEEESKVISKIMLQMIEDAELIPLYHFAAPFIINSGTVRSTKLDLRESIKFAKIEMK